MTKQTEALKLALEAVYETIIQWDEGGGKRSRRELARRIVALAEQPAQQEPVAGEPLPCPFCGNSGLDFDEGSTYRWGVASCSGCGASCGEIRREYPDQGQWHTEAIAEWNRRTSPPASKPWVGLTNKDIYECEPKTDWYDSVEFARAIEAKLKEKNG